MFPPDFIVAERIGSGLTIQSKKRLLEVLGEYLAASLPGISSRVVFDRLLERERLGSTGLGHGIALPHARMPQITKAIGAFVQLESGVDFDAIDGQPVDLAFALLVPETAAEEHLQLLAKLATLFSSEKVRETLRNATDADQVLKQIQHWEALPEGA